MNWCLLQQVTTFGHRYVHVHVHVCSPSLSIIIMYMYFIHTLYMGIHRYAYCICTCTCTCLFLFLSPSPPPPSLSLPPYHVLIPERWWTDTMNMVVSSCHSLLSSTVSRRVTFTSSEYFTHSIIGHLHTYMYEETVSRDPWTLEVLYTISFTSMKLYIVFSCYACAHQILEFVLFSLSMNMHDNMHSISFEFRCCDDYNK